MNLTSTKISIQQFNNLLVNLPFSISDWSLFLHLSERTIKRHQRENSAFKALYSEKIEEIMNLYEYGLRVFREKLSFDAWLSTKSAALDDRFPKELLNSAFGIGMIKEELSKIEHGILA